MNFAWLCAVLENVVLQGKKHQIENALSCVESCAERNKMP